MRTMISILLIGCATLFFAFGYILLYGASRDEQNEKIGHKNIVDSIDEYTPNVSEVQSSVVENENERSAHILFGGDMMFDRYIREMAMQNGYEAIFADVTDLIDEHHCVIANVEGPITNYRSASLASAIGSPENYRFTFDPSVAQVLGDHNFCVANIGNNHIDNFGVSGILSTKRYLNEAGIGYFGDTHSTGEKRYIIYDINDVRFGFVNYNSFVPHAREHTLSDIEIVKEKLVDFIVIYTHWGVEYQQVASDDQVEAAHQFIDAGADLIIGSHPHVVQNTEEYNGKKIFYSLGNFVFDQYFSKETTRGLLVSVTFSAADHSMIYHDHVIELTSMGTVRSLQDN